MKSIIKWKDLPADISVIPSECRILVLTRGGDLFFAERIDLELEVEVPEDYEEEDVDVVYWGEINLPNEM
jgi:hypothetical protein